MTDDIGAREPFIIWHSKFFICHLGVTSWLNRLIK